MSDSNVNHISKVPHEILMHILRNLTYTEIQQVRPTCRAFNAAGADLQMLALRKLKCRIDSMIEKFVKARWFKYEHPTQHARYLAYKRMYRGANSLMILAGLIQVADASTFHLIKEGLLPPFPGALLEDLERAMSLATRRNPLVGKKRLENIYHRMIGYFDANPVSADIHLRPNLLFNVIVDLVDCLPMRKEQLKETDAGFYFNCLLPQIQIKLAMRDNVQNDGPGFINILVQLGLHGVCKFIRTDQFDFIAPNLDLEDGTISFTEVRLHVACNDNKKAGVKCLKVLKWVDPDHFYAVLAGTAMVRQSEKGEELVEPAAFTYSSKGCPAELFPDI